MKTQTEQLAVGVANQTLHSLYETNTWIFLERLPDVGLFVETPVPVVTCTLAYLLFVCVLGPIMMRNREPYQLKNVIRLYNLLMVLLAAISFILIYDTIGTFGSLVDCRKMFTLVDECRTRVYQMGNFLLFVRMSEYVDTIFFTLRKKNNQVTFLHVFHHTFVPLYGYWITRTAPIRFNVYIMLVNSAVHVIMYFYYFLATYQSQDSMEDPGLLMRIINYLLKFKKYMTQLQLLQFISLGLYTIWAAVQPNRCNIPRIYILSNFLMAFGFLSMFTHFYIKSYKSAARASAAKNKKQRAE